MPEHRRLITAFARALEAKSVEDVAVDAFVGDAARVRDRLRIYRGNVQASAHKALLAAFPVVAQIVGDSFFEGMAHAYAAAVPSKSGDLNEYGGEFADFLASFPPADLPYLPDVAALEWRVHRAHYAADADPLDPSRLAAVPAERYAELRFVLAPGVALLDSRWPIARIWQVHQPDFTGEFDVDLDRPERALVHRPRFRAQVRPLSSGVFAFISACLEGVRLGQAFERALAADCGWQPDADLAQLVGERVIVDFDLG